MAKPFLRWPGGKQWLVPHLLELIPKEFGRYYEPFLGGAALFFALRPPKASLSDENVRLIETYRAVKSNPHELAKILQGWENNKSTYYKVRGNDYTARSDRAAQFIYLNKTCWNGLYRVNREGKFNVPFSNNGREVLELKTLLEASNALKRAKLLSGGFEKSLKDAKEGDVIYLDPPYTVSHSQNGFRQYNEKLFSWSDQIRLAKTAISLSRRGCFVVISNAMHEPLLELYKGFTQISLTRSSVLAGNASYRRKVQEVLLVSKSR